jgi:branched-chain amino acid transport system substrate-binding protein
MRTRPRVAQGKSAQRGLVVALALAVVAVMLTACGPRVPPAGLNASAGQNSTSNDAQLAPSQSSSATTTTLAGPGGSVAGTQPSTAVSAGGTAGAARTTPAASNPVTPASPAAFSFNPQSESAACPNNSGNTASDKGVTPSSITFGNVSGLTGPLPGTDNQGPEAVQALFSAVNAAGGICGRKLSLDVEDDQQNSSTNASDVADLISKGVFAFVGSTSDADNGGVPDMVQANVPDVGFAINCNRSLAATYWSPAGGSCEEKNGHSYFDDTGFALAKAAGYLPSRMAFLAYNIAISAQAAQQFASLYQQLGGTVCYTDYSVSSATASLTPDAVQMQQNNCGGVYTALDVTGNAKLLQALQQQSIHLSYVGTTFDAYTPTQISDAGESAAQGLISNLNFIPLNEPQPAVQLYQQQLATYEPGDQPSAFGFMAWEAGEMLIYALDAVGHNPTRANIVQVFSSLQNWTGGGALGPYTPSSHSFPLCGVDVVVQGTSFVRKAPSSGMFCGGAALEVG